MKTITKAFIISLSIFITACDSDSSSSISIPEEFRASTYKEFQASSVSQSYTGIWLYVGKTNVTVKRIFSDTERLERDYISYLRKIAFFNEVSGQNGIEIHITDCEGYSDDIYTINNARVTANDSSSESTQGSASGFNELKMTRTYGYNRSSEEANYESDFYWIKVSDDVNASIGMINHSILLNGQAVPVNNSLRCFQDSIIDGVSTSISNDTSTSIKFWNRLFRYHDDPGGKFSFEFEETDDLQNDSYWVDFSAPTIYLDGQYSEFNTINTIEEFAWSVGIDAMSFTLKNNDNGTILDSDGELVITF